jgi:hypothetical protein
MWTPRRQNARHPIVTLVLVGVGLAAPAHAHRGKELTAQQQKTLRANYSTTLTKLKGPYTENFCVCANGERLPVQAPSGAIRIPCANEKFCSAYRSPAAQALAAEGVWIANLFARDVYHWNDVRDHSDLVRGYVLERYFVETNPKHKYAEMRAYGGLAGSEYEVPASMRFAEKWLASPEWDDTRDFLLSYELQRRYFVREDQGTIAKVRAQAVRVQQQKADFKPFRDAIHNQLSAGLIPSLLAYRDKLPAGSDLRKQVDDIVGELRKLTSIDESALKGQAAAIQDAGVRGQIEDLLPAPNAAQDEAIAALARIMVLVRQTVAARKIAPPDARRLVDLNVTAATVMQGRTTAFVEGGATARQYVRVLGALDDAAYGTGLLNAREREAAAALVKTLGAPTKQRRRDFAARLKDAERVVEWAQGNAWLAFAEVWSQWTLLMPQASGVVDDVLRGSPLLGYANVARGLEDFATGKARVRHDLFGTAVDSDVRMLNPGLAHGRLLVAPKEHGYSRSDVIALPETPAELEPAAGIVTRGEGNVLSHVQLLARALGVPNVVVGPEPYRKVQPHDGRNVLFIATPGGRVILKDMSAITPEERAVYQEYTKNEARTGEGALGDHASGKLHIDKAKLDVATKAPLGVEEVRRKDSGRMCGPKAAFLGELKHHFPTQVARGLVVPFGAYYAHYQAAPVALPEKHRKLAGATPGEPLPQFVERTYAEFFGELIPARRSERELSAWIGPRLDVIRHSIQEAPLDPALKQQIRDGLDERGLLQASDKTQTVGCFVRSDTNVEDLDNFNGAGLNLTVFNRRSLDDIYTSVKEVWASPFQFRSFSWRQTLIDEPLWVLPSIVILESIPSDKSGVLVTADIDTGDMRKMVVATSEGVGGAVDGTSAETVLWSPDGTELLTMFKSPWRRILVPGGTSMVASTGKDHVLDDREIAEITRAGREITEKFEATRDPSGRPRPWDIEFGFAGGKLWLFQCRPFVGNDNLKNVPALAALEGGRDGGDETLSLDDRVK